MQSKPYLCGITSSGNKQLLEEMVEPIKHLVRGLVFTFHYPKDDGADYLEANKGDGEIIYAKWCQRHGYSQNHFLYQGPMQDGDYFILLDSAERISAEFLTNKYPQIQSQMQERNIAMVANYGKGFIFRYNEQLEFRNSPHWNSINLDGSTANLELPLTDFWNVRAQYRDKFQWVGHYVKYMLYPAGSNHALLGLEKNGNPQELFPKREKLRLEFRKYLKNELGVELTVGAFKRYLRENDGRYPEKFKFYLNKEKVWNDAYRYWVLKDESLLDNHDFKDMVVV